MTTLSTSSLLPGTMSAARVHRFGPPEVIKLEDTPLPTPGAGEVLVRVKAAGVGPWDGWIRAGKSEGGMASNIRINGKQHSVDVDGDTPLLRVLRDVP